MVDTMTAEEAAEQYGYEPHIQPRRLTHTVGEPVMTEVHGVPVVIEEIEVAITLVDDRPVWDRQPVENDQYWAWFTTYRDMPPEDRTLADAYREHTGKEFEWHTPTYWQQACVRFRWADRATEYDRYVDEQQRTALEAHRLRARVAQMKLGSAMREKAREALEVLNSTIYQNVRQPDGSMVREVVSALTPAQITRLAEVGTRLERMAVGETDIDGGAVHALTAIQVNVKIGDDELVERARTIIETRQGSAASGSQ